MNLKKTYSAIYKDTLQDLCFGHNTIQFATYIKTGRFDHFDYTAKCGTVCTIMVYYILCMKRWRRAESTHAVYYNVKCLDFRTISPKQTNEWRTISGGRHSHHDTALIAREERRDFAACSACTRTCPDRWRQCWQKEKIIDDAGERHQHAAAASSVHCTLYSSLPSFMNVTGQQSLEHYKT